MPYLWSLSERWEQAVAKWQQVWSGRAGVSMPYAISLGLTLAMLALSIALGSFLLFLLAIAQGLAIQQFRPRHRNVMAHDSSPVAADLLADFRQQLPALRDVQRVGYRTATLVYRILYRLTWCVLISLCAGMATLSAFVLQQGELWRWSTLQNAGPPLGAVLVTGLAILSSLLVTGWMASRWSLLPR